MSLDDEAWRIAERVCTPLELDTLRLMENGLGYKRIARLAGVSWETVRDRVKRAEARIKRATKEAV